MDHIDKNFRDMLSLLNQHGAEYLVVGAHALGAYDVPRATGDLDIWVRPSPANAPRIWAALCEFGAPLGKSREEDFTTPRYGLHIGVPPGRIDILTTVSGIGFDEAWAQRVSATLCGADVNVLGLQSLIRNKTASGRPKDVQDVERLLRHHPHVQPNPPRDD